MAVSSQLEVEIMLFDCMINKPKRFSQNLKVYNGTKQDIAIVSFVLNSRKMIQILSSQEDGIKM